MPFKPKGEVARWRIVYELFRAAEVGEEVTYETLAEALGVHPVRERHVIQQAARQATERLLEKESRAVETLPNTGYRLVPAARQIPLAGQQAQRAGNALERGRSLVTHVRLEDLSETERQIVGGIGVMFAQVAQWAKQVEQRVDSHEGRLSDIEEELARLRAERAG